LAGAVRLAALPAAGLVIAACGASAASAAHSGQQHSGNHHSSGTSHSSTGSTHGGGGVAAHLTSKRISGTAKGKHPYQISCAYPVLQVARGSSAASFNKAVSSIVGPYVAEFRHFVATDTPPPDFRKYPSTLNCVWSKAILTGHTVSVVLNGSFFGAGAAHPIAHVWSVNYDLIHGRVYSLADLFKPRSDYLRALTADSRSALAKIFGHYTIWSPPSPLAASFSAWSLTGSTMNITFQDYQVGPYAIGTPTVNLPTKSLASIANPSGPLLHP
jgi:hypothetical protein